MAQADQATIFGAPLSATFVHGAQHARRAIVTVILIILMSLTTFTTQRQLMTKNMPASALDNPFAQQQKMLLYVLPLIFAISGINFPVGVLIYWLTTNLWSMGQQFYVIRRMPRPGSRGREGAAGAPARASVQSLGAEPAVAAATEPGAPAPPVSGQRQQPKRQKRNQRGATRAPATSASEAARQQFRAGGRAG